MRQQPTDLYAQPRDLLLEAERDYGRHATVDTCLTLLEGSLDFDQLPVPMTYLAGSHALMQMERGYLEDRNQTHWPRIWAARGFLYVWTDYAEDGVVTALADPHARVREMTAKIVALRELHTASDALLTLVHDTEPRVQVAALRAATVVGEKIHLSAVGDVVSDDRSVQIAQSSAQRALRRRLDVAIYGAHAAR